LIKDETGKGLFYANSQIYANRLNALGTYVYILDDDDFLVSKFFISDLKEIHKKINPDVIIAKGYIGEQLLPGSKAWKQGFVTRGTIGSPNFIVKNELFQEHSKHWCASKAGDFFFINQVMQSKPSTHWWNKVVFIAPVNNGEPEKDGDQDTI
jgi:hypothetical protein